MYYPRLRDLREDKDLTQEELVKILGMHKKSHSAEAAEKEMTEDFA